MTTALYLAIGEILLDAFPEFVDGEFLQAHFSIERHTLYSCVSELRKAGYEIENIPVTRPEGGRTGWRLVGTREVPLVRAELNGGANVPSVCGRCKLDHNAPCGLCRAPHAETAKLLSGTLLADFPNGLCSCS